MTTIYSNYIFKIEIYGFDIMTLEVHYDSTIYYVASEKPVIIDTGTGRRNEEILEKLNGLKALDKVEKIILTHNHADHSGGAADLSEELGVPVLAHELDGIAVAEGNSELTGAVMFGFDMKKLEVTYLKADDTIDCGDVKFEVIHTPGHSPGSITLYDKQTKSIFCGDLAFMDGGVGRWDLPGGDYRELVRSYEKIIKLELENFYPGHGPGAEGSADEYVKLSYKYLKSCEAFA
jgi:glyoxylase-like metal-dependent hydrolase (beta-lactamase superfamily II)